MYSILLELKRTCSLEFQRELFKNKFSLELVGNHSKQRAEIKKPGVIPLWTEECHLECRANLGKNERDILPHLDILKLIYNHHSDIINYKIGNLPF